MDPDTRRNIIMKHYQTPVNRGLFEDESYIHQNSNNESCIDNIDIMLLIEDNRIKDIRFDGEACVISISATSILIETLLNKTIEEAKTILINYQNMIDEKEYDPELLKNLIVYDDIKKQPNRKTCALLPKMAVSEILKRLEKES